MDIKKLKYPIGKFKKPDIITKALLENYIHTIATFPAKLKSEIMHLSDAQLDTRYRPEGWTIRQLVHHCADSHINSVIRLKLTLTEDTPTIKPYYEERWAELVDSKTFPVEASVKILEGIHMRWTAILETMNEEDLAKTFIHPENNREIRLDTNIALYAWHCNHHLAHITSLKKSKGWK